MDEAFLQHWAARARTAEPTAVAVLLRGSHARDEAGPHSDLDLTVLTRESPLTRYRAELVEAEDGRLLHLSVGAMSWAEWLAERDVPAAWSFSLPTRQAARVLWVIAAYEAALDDPLVLQPPSPPNLEDFVEAAAKVKNAFAAGNDLALRLAAQDLARWAPSLLRLLNPSVTVGSRAAALRAILDFPVVPPGYRQDMLVCLGLSGQAVPAEELHERASRLAVGIIDLLAPRVEEFAGQLEPDLPRYLRDGRLRPYLRQGM
ncbi:MAG: nucleotidyltransferase domain-containing protein [Chloroflexota bacterium]